MRDFLRFLLNLVMDSRDMKYGLAFLTIQYSFKGALYADSIESTTGVSCLLILLIKLHNIH